MSETYDPIATLDELDRRAMEGGGPRRIAKQHAGGKLTARERIDALLDPGTFVETDRLVVHQCRDFGMESQHIPGTGALTCYGPVAGRSACGSAPAFPL